MEKFASRYCASNPSQVGTCYLVTQIFCYYRSKHAVMQENMGKLPGQNPVGEIGKEICWQIFVGKGATLKTGYPVQLKTGYTAISLSFKKEFVKNKMSHSPQKPFLLFVRNNCYHINQRFPFVGCFCSLFIKSTWSDIRPFFDVWYPESGNFAVISGIRLDSA